MADDARTTETRRRLVEATMETIRTQGIAKVSARTIGATAEVNQALVFYHFGTVDALVAFACTTATRERVDAYAARLDAVATFTDLITVARELGEEEAALGNVTVLGQTLAGSQGNPTLAAATGEALGMWTSAVEGVLARLLVDSPLAEVVDARTLAELVSATFIGIELVGVTHEGPSEATSSALDRLERLARTLDGLGPVARRALRTALRRT